MRQQTLTAVAATLLAGATVSTVGIGLGDLNFWTALAFTQLVVGVGILHWTGVLYPYSEEPSSRDLALGPDEVEEYWE